MTTLSVSTKILERKEIRENDATFSTVLGTINRQNNRLQNLIDQVMTNSLGYEEIELHKEKVSMPDFLNSIVNDFQIAYPDISIAKELDTQKISLNLDKFHLTTAITNVLENAVKYGCKNIAVKASLLNNEFSISISDDGIGISKSKHSLLFDKFYRVEQGDLHDAKGLGLGLYYVDQIIKAHQGTINVVSDLGKGATFDLRFLI